MRKILKALMKKESEFHSCVEEMERKIQNRCDFNCGIENPPGDGFCVINIDTSNLAPIITCIETIERDGRLTESEHRAICI